MIERFQELQLCENVALTTQFGEMTLNAIYVETAMLRADLSFGHHGEGAPFFLDEWQRESTKEVKDIYPKWSQRAIDTY